MGACCSTAPPDHSYAQISNIETAPNNNGLVHVTHGRSGVEIHSESGSLGEDAMDIPFTPMKLSVQSEYDMIFNDQDKDDIQVEMVDDATQQNMIKSIQDSAQSLQHNSMNNALKSIENTPKSVRKTLEPMEDTAKSIIHTPKRVKDRNSDESKDRSGSPTDEIDSTPSPQPHKDTQKSTHSVFASQCIIDGYEGNNDIRRLRKLYMKKHPKPHKSRKARAQDIKHGKSRHSVKRSMEIIANHQDMELLKLKRKYKRKQKQKENEELEKVKRGKSRHSVRRSSVIINEYKGNNDIWILKKKYMEEYGKKNDTKTGQIPAKPRDISVFDCDYTNGLYSEMCEYICAHTHYVGMAEFADDKEMCIEIVFTANNEGRVEGIRMIVGGKSGVSEGKGRIYKDVRWNSDCNAYEGCVRFEWMDVCRDEMVTKLVFNTSQNYFDMKHLYFEGQCYQYEKGKEEEEVRKGVFNMVCVSMRKRNMRKRDALLKYHQVDIWSMSHQQLQTIPKYIKCINITAVKMHKIYTANARRY
eukprot:225373_1